MLRGAASRVGPLALRLREGARYFQEGAHLKRGGPANDTTPVHAAILTFIKILSTRLDELDKTRFGKRGIQIPDLLISLLTA